MINLIKHGTIPAAAGAAGAADRVRARRRAARARARAATGRHGRSFGRVGGFRSLSRAPLGRRVPGLGRVRGPTPSVMMVRPVRAPAPVVPVRVAPGGTGEGERVTNPRLKVRLRRVEASAESTSGRAGADPGGKHRALPVIICVVMPRPVERPAALVVSVRTVLVRSLPTVGAAAVRETERDTTEGGTYTLRFQLDPSQTANTGTQMRLVQNLAGQVGEPQFNERNHKHTSERLVD